MRRGRLLEGVAVQVLREEHPDFEMVHNDGPARHYYRDPDARLGATPDIIVENSAKGRGVIQIKSVQPQIFKTKWVEDGILQPPLWIAVQAAIEADLTGAEWAAVAPIIVDHGVDVPLIEIKIHRPLLAKIRETVREFWGRVERNEPPPPDYGKDGALLSSIYSEDDGSGIDLSGNARVADLLEDLERLKKIEKTGKDAEKDRKRISAELIHLLGNASHGIVGDGRVIEAKTVKRDGYMVQPSQYRFIKVRTAKQ